MIPKWILNILVVISPNEILIETTISSHIAAKRFGNSSWISKGQVVVKSFWLVFFEKGTVYMLVITNFNVSHDTCKFARRFVGFIRKEYNGSNYDYLYTTGYS